jgi:hypothetical protein
MTEYETLNKIFQRLKKTAKFKDSGYIIKVIEGCGESITIDVDDNRNPGHSFELVFDKFGKLNNIDFGF